MVFKHSIRWCSIVIVIIMLVSCVILSTAGAVSAGNFTDLSSGSWYYDQVSYVLSKGLFYGVSDTEFSPNSDMTRGMFITVLGRMAGIDASTYCKGTVNNSDVCFRKGPGTSYGYYSFLSKGTVLTITGEDGDWYAVKVGSQAGYIYAKYVSPSYHKFSDVSYGQYYTGYAIWAYEKGIVNGYGTAEAFAPDLSITREQICKILNNYAHIAGTKLNNSGNNYNFVDDTSISSWAYDDVYAMLKFGIVVGEQTSEGYYFYPQEAATRAEVAAMVCRFDKAIAEATPSATASPIVTATPMPTPSSSVDQADTPATILDSKAYVHGDTVKIGLFVKTASYDTSVNSVTLNNCQGNSFEYGYLDSNRHFVSQGTLSSGTLVITSDGSNFTVRDGDGNAVYNSSAAFVLHAVPDSGNKGVTKVNNLYRYFGDFEFRQIGSSSCFALINVVNIEDYVKGVIPWEFGSTWPLETLKAAAVAARTYVMKAWNTYSSYGFDVLNNSSSQVYKGRNITCAESYFAVSDEAVDETVNQYLTYDGKLCTCFYFSSDGGATEDCGHVFSENLAYLIGKIDPYEAAIADTANNYTYTITQKRTGSALTSLASDLGLGTIANDGIRIDTYETTGNVKSITITDVNGNSYTIDQASSASRWSFLNHFGFTCYSYRFTVSYDASTDSFTVTRYGYGHNVGMSQWGAYSMAKNYAKDYQDILGFYYVGTHLQYGEF
jgi:stage II sporulation protein D